MQRQIRPTLPVPAASRWAWGVPIALISVLVLIGCPSNFCLLTVNGRCEWASCPDGASYNDARRACTCRPDRIALNGSCLTRDAANTYCGRGAHFELGGCAPNRCPAGYELDGDTGYCLTRQETGQVASNMGVAVGQTQKLGCPPGQQLVIEGGQAACVPSAESCGADERWDGVACRKIAQCPPASTYDAATRTCTRIAASSDGAEGYTVDLATWVRTAYGADGGVGSSDLCGALKKHPLSFGVGPASSLWVRGGFQVQVAGGDVSRAHVLTLTTVDATGQPVPLKGATIVQQEADAILGALVAGGGKATPEVANTTVKCQIVNASAPAAVTISGGA